MTDAIVGAADRRFDHVRDLLAENLQTGVELGASLAVDLDGKTVVDIWGGYADAGRTRAWESDTIVNVWSSTKTVTSLAALILVDRGQLDPFEPVGAYWPEFAANGKDDVQVRHILSHTSGVSGWEQPFTIPDMFDLERSTRMLATQAPWWEPGTASGYHGPTMGHLVGEIVRRVSGKSLTEFVQTEIAEPLGADFRIGALETDDHRIAEIVPPTTRRIVDLDAHPADSPMVKTLLGPTSDPASANWTGWRRAEIGAANGHGNARSLARILSVVSRGGTVDGVRLLSPSTIDMIFQTQADGVDLVLDIPLRWGIGFGLPQPATVPSIPDDADRICFWGGWGGSMVVMHPDRGLTISYVMNQMAPGIIGSEASNSYIAAIYEALR